LKIDLKAFMREYLFNEYSKRTNFFD